MKIKAAVFDIDGTLVPYGAPGPGQAAVQALRELAEKNPEALDYVYQYPELRQQTPETT